VCPMGALSFWGFDDDDSVPEGQPVPAAAAPATVVPGQGQPVLNLLKGSIRGDPTRRPLRILADFVTCTQ